MRRGLHFPASFGFGWLIRFTSMASIMGLSLSGSELGLQTSYTASEGGEEVGWRALARGLVHDDGPSLSLVDLPLNAMLLSAAHAASCVRER